MRVNSSNNIYAEDISEIQRDINELWQQPDLIYLKHLGLYIYASKKSIMDKALKVVGLHCENPTIIQTCEGDIISINSSGKINSICFTL